MHGATFVHDGRTGPWVYTLTRERAADGSFSAAADISFDGRHRCKLVLCVPNISEADGYERLRQTCVDWIDNEESLANA